MSGKMTCPGCGAHLSDVLRAYEAGRPCPRCGLSATAATEVLAVRRVRGDGKLKTDAEAARGGSGRGSPRRGRAGLVGAGMTTWEERMSARAAARQAAAVAEQEEPEAPGTPTAEDEAAIERASAELTPEQAAGRCGYACACLGPPPNCTLCYCHISAEAIARVLGRQCAWCASVRAVAT